jgi:hypothetical protein
MVSSLSDIPSAGTAKMVGGKLDLPAQTAAGGDTPNAEYDR